MFRKIKYLTTIHKQENSTCYFFDKKENLVIPIETSYCCSHSRYFQKELGTYDTSSKNTESSSIENIIRLLGGNILGVRIYLQLESIYYAYLILEQNYKVYELPVSFETAVLFFEKGEIPILIHKKILNEQGIKVTREMLEKSLVEG